MPIPSTGQISLNDDINATLQKSTNESNVSLEDNNAEKFATPADGSTVSGRSMSELRGQSLFQINPSTAATGALGQSLHMDGLSSSHNSVKVLEPALTTAPVFTNTRGTFSFWIKIHETTSSERYLYTSGTSSSNSLVSILLHSSGTNHKLYFRVNAVYYTSKAIFVDKAGWYNFVISLDSTVPQDDIKVNAYANGIRLTWESVGNLTDNQALQFGTNQRINDWAFADGYGADATYANFIFVDGSALLPNEFGELSQGIWIPKGVNTPSSQSLVTTNLVADYQFQGNANDTSVGGTTYNGTPSNVTFQQNNYNVASFTGGSASQISLGASSQFTGSTLTFSFWYMPTAAPSGTTYKILFSNYNTGSPNFNVSRNTDNSLEFGVITGSSGTWYRKTAPNAVELNNWKHYAFVLDSSQSAEVDKIKVYIDGGLFPHFNNTGTSTTGNFLNNSNNLLIGNWAHAPGYTDTSKFGELQIYTSALTETQVLQNFNATKYKYFYGLNGWHLNFDNSDEGSIVSGSILNFDAGDWDADGTDETSFSGTAWDDLSSNSYDMAFVNTPTWNAANGGYFDLASNAGFSKTASISGVGGDITAEFWIDADESGNFTLFHANQGSNNSGITGLYIGNAGSAAGDIEIYRRNAANDTTSSTTISTGAGGMSTMSTEGWVHFVITITAGNAVKGYKNGALIATSLLSNATQTMANSYGFVSLGVYNNSSYEYDGKIAQFRLYSKVLTAQEVVQNFRATQGHYNVLGLADISGNAKKSIANGTNLDGSDHTGDKPDVAFPTFTQEGIMTSVGLIFNGGLSVADSEIAGSVYARFSGPHLPETGKWYWEVELTGNGNGYVQMAGISPADFWYTSGTSSIREFSSSYGIHAFEDDGEFWSLGTKTHTFTSTNPSGGKVGFAYDVDAGNLYIYVNGTVQNSGNAVVTGLSGAKKIVAQSANLSEPLNFNFGAKGFSYTVPSGYKALSSDNLPTATGVDPVNQKKPRDYFESVTYTGTGVRKEIKSLDFQPDLIWIKDRTTNYSHVLLDSVRGVNSEINPNDTSAVYTETNGLTAFTSTGFNLGNLEYSYNKSGDNYVSWNWKAGGAPTVDNSASAGAAPTLGSVMIDGVASTATLAGSIAATKISANTAAGFSIVKYTGNNTDNATVGHGLGVAPNLVIVKDLDATQYWCVGGSTVGDGKNLYLNDSGVKLTRDRVKSVQTNTFTLGNHFETNSTNDFISYCFANIDGYQRIGSYTGNGLSNGPFVYTGFKPAWVMIKSSSTGNSGDWIILDNARNPVNTLNARIDANASDDEATDAIMDFHSNGFKLITSSAAKNRDGYEFIYLAIAEDPAKYAQGIGQESDTEKFLEKGASTTEYPANHFQGIAYPGNGGTQLINLNFSPGLTWIKSRTDAYDHNLYDILRGADGQSGASDQVLMTNKTNAQEGGAGDVTITGNGFKVVETNVGASGQEVNKSGKNFISYSWKAGDTIETKKPTYTSAGILTSNLTLHYNTADSNTYAGSGTTIYDLTSNDNDGTLTNGPTWVDSANGNYFDFDGSNDFIATGYTHAAGSTATFEFWINPENDSNRHHIIGSLNQSGGSNSGLALEIDASDRIALVLGDGTNYESTPTADRPTVPTGKWMHIAVSLNGTTVKMYHNGILLSTYTAAINFTNVARQRQYYIGPWGAPTTSHSILNGKFAQARIYTAELTQAQIRANYDATRTLYQGVGTTANVLQTGLLNNIDVDSFSSYDSSKFGADNKVAVFPGGNATGTDNGTGINLPTNIDDPMRTASAFTISVWYKHDTQNNSYGGKIVSLLNNIYNFINVNANGTWYGRVANSSNTSTEIDGLEAFSVGTWYHIVWTGNAANGCTLYCNGVKQGNGAWNGTFMNYSSPHYQHNKIGHQGIEVGYLKGSIDMVRFYNREVTSAEVKTLFHETSATTGTLNTLGDTSCYAAYNFNSDSGTTVNDLSDNYDAVSFGSLSFATDAEVTGWMVKDLTSNKNDLGGFYNATISKANSWGTSIKYDGTGDFVTLPVGLGRTATQDVTRELWVKIDDYPASGNTDGLLYIGDMSANQYYENLRVTNTGTIDYQERPTNSSGGSDFILSTSSYAGTLSEGVWYHVAYTVQGRLKKIYINGKLVATKTASYDKVNNSTYGGSLGSFRGSTVATTQGEIAQFRSYTSALTDAQIKANYDATKAQFYSALMHSSVSVNEKAGFSIAKHKGDGVLSSRIIHGLSSQPDFLVVKNIDTASTSWATWLSVFSSPSETLFLDYAGRSTQYTNRFTNVSETTFQAGNNGSGTTASSEVNKDGSEMVVYAWKSVPGYSKIGRYKGTGSSGHSIEIGFQPSWVMIKNITTTSSTGWLILDAARDSINDNGNAIFASANIAEWGPSNTTINIDFTPTGFEIQNSYVVVNGSSDSYIYMAFA